MPIHTTAQVDKMARIGNNVSIWGGTHIRDEASVGDGTTIGEGCYIGPGVSIGINCKIQNGVYIYDPCVVMNGVFIGPKVVITNDKNPRAINPDFSLKKSTEWSAVGSILMDGASLGSGSVIVSPVKIGEWSMVAAGAVVLRDVPAFALVAGNPATQIGWIGKSGHRLKVLSENKLICPQSGTYYTLTGSHLSETDL